LPDTGWGVWVGRAVGVAVGFGVGFGVGLGVGGAVVGGAVVGGAVAGRAVTGGAVEGVAGVVGPGDAVGTTATGPCGDGLAVGDGWTDGSADGVDAEGVGSPPVPADADAPAEDVAEGPGTGLAAETVGGGLPRATSPGRAGAMKPAVSATVARMRFKSPMATTSRAR
jgi:hypothetical protein